MPITDKYAIVLQYLSTYHHLCDKGQWSCYRFAGNGPLKRLLVRGRWVAFECWVSEYILYSPENLMQWGISLYGNVNVNYGMVTDRFSGHVIPSQDVIWDDKITPSRAE
jgi:hypothetical protein